MSYAIKYSFQFKGMIDEELIEGYLLRKNFTGNTTVLHCVEGAGVVITTRKSDIDSVGAGIYGKDCVVSLIYNSNLDIDDFFVDDARAWQLVIIRGGIEYFRGYVKTEMSERPMAFIPYAFKVTATDGLADLKDKLVLNSSGKISSAMRTPVDMLLYLLGNTGINYTLKTITSLRYVSLNGNPLANHKIDSLRFVENLEPISVFDAILTLCNAYRCKLIQHEGAWLFMSVDVLSYQTATVYEYLSINVDGTTSVSELSHSSIDLNFTVEAGTYTTLPNFSTKNAFINTATERYERSVKSKKYKFEYGSYKNRLWVPFVDGLKYFDIEYWEGGQYKTTPNTSISLHASDNYTNLDNIRFGIVAHQDSAPTYMPYIVGQHLGQPEVNNFVLFGGVQVYDTEEVTIKVTITNIDCRGGRIMCVLVPIGENGSIGTYDKMYSLGDGGDWNELDYPNGKTAKTIIIENVYKEVVDDKPVSFASQDSYSFNLKSSKCPVIGKVYLYLLPAVCYEEQVVSSGGFANITSEQATNIVQDTIVYLSNGSKWKYLLTGDKTQQSSYQSITNIEYVEYSLIAIEKSRKSSVNESDFEQFTIENTANIDGIVEDKDITISFGESGNENNYTKLYDFNGDTYAQSWYSQGYTNDVMSFKRLSCINDFVSTCQSRRIIDGTIKGNKYKIPYGLKINKSRFNNEVFQILEHKEDLYNGISDVLLSKVITTKPSTLKITSKNNFGGGGAVIGTGNNSSTSTSAVSSNGTLLTYRAGQDLNAGTLVMVDSTTGYLIPFEPIHANSGRLIGMVRNGNYNTYQFVDVAKTGDSVLLPIGSVSFTIGVNYWAAPNGGITRIPPVQNSANDMLSQLVGKTIKPNGAVFTMLEIQIGEPYKIK